MSQSADLMSAEDQVDFETAVGDPAAYYADPQAIVADEQLAQDQKQRFLTEWAQDIVDRQTAADEGMGADRPATDDRDEALLQQLNACLAQLAATPAEPVVRPARTWWRRWAKPD